MKQEVKPFGISKAPYLQLIEMRAFSIKTRRFFLNKKTEQIHNIFGYISIISICIFIAGTFTDNSLWGIPFFILSIVCSLPNIYILLRRTGFVQNIDEHQGE